MIHWGGSDNAPTPAVTSIATTAPSLVVQSFGMHGRVSRPRAGYNLRQREGSRLPPLTPPYHPHTHGTRPDSSRVQPDCGQREPAGDIREAFTPRHTACYLLLSPSCTACPSSGKACGSVLARAGGIFGLRNAHPPEDDPRGKAARTEDQVPETPRGDR